MDGIPLCYILIRNQENFYRLHWQFGLGTSILFHQILHRIYVSSWIVREKASLGQINIPFRNYPFLSRDSSTHSRLSFRSVETGTIRSLHQLLDQRISAGGGIERRKNRSLGDAVSSIEHRSIGPDANCHRCTDVATQKPINPHTGKFRFELETSSSSGEFQGFPLKEI